jgi:hypothetical protein
VRIHLPGEHPGEFELFDAARVTLDVGDDRIRGVLVVFHLDQVEELAGTFEAFGQFTDAVDGFFQRRALASQRLCACRIVPDVRVFQFAIDFFQTLDLGVVVKDTPGANAAGR